MPRCPSRFPGIAVLGLLALGACASPSAAAPAPSPSPSATPTPAVVVTPFPAAGNAPWSLNLDLTGDLAAHVSGTAPSDDTVHNDCTGPDSSRLGSWGSTMAFAVGQQRYALFMLVKDYRGAGVFTSDAQIEVSSEDQKQAWQNGSDDRVSFTVGPGEQSGLIDAVLSNVTTPAQKLNVSGHWSCHP
jgi:hypothetical protein